MLKNEWTSPYSLEANQMGTVLGGNRLRWKLYSKETVPDEKLHLVTIHSFIHSFIQTISIALLQVHFYSEALPTQQGYSAGVSRGSATGNCELRTCPRSLRSG